MANTIRAAKNTFSGGLVMDLTPDNTSEKVLSSALNATFVTFNGNELSLQNDMGNGRVETARLPEGYIPVGTCEFGDIIYIVSYNPLTNKSLIGCFPSPERNISSEEIGGTGQQLEASDFLVLLVVDNEEKPTGEIKASSVKKIIYNNKLNPGDKFIIYDRNTESNKDIFSNASTITDVGNKSHVYGAFPKLLRIHVVAIEDSGKINFLDSTVRWYNDDVNNKDYFIRKAKTDGSGKADIDSYRNLLSSGYSIFQSKISGKLALLIELERINGFSCTYSVYSHSSNNALTADPTTGLKSKKYLVYWNVNWETENPNINPSYVVLTKSVWSDKPINRGTIGTWVSNNDKYILSYSTYESLYPAATYENYQLPTAFYNDNNELNSSYTFWEINKGGISTSNYDDFIADKGAGNCSSYEGKLYLFLQSLVATYGNDALVKLNVERITNDGDYLLYPNPGHYYINAVKLTYEKPENSSQEELIEKVYTGSNSNGLLKEITPTNISDVIVNNYFHHPVYLEGSQFIIPVSLEISKDGTTYENTVDTSNLIYNYELTPAMEYGLLSEYAVEGYIDFSKIGSGIIDLTSWRYFNGENSTTLTFGFDAYTEDNMGIAEIVFEFYDNQGMAAAYHIKGKESYSGQFTEIIPLNGYANNYKLSNIDHLGELHYHCGQPVNELFDNVVKFDENDLPVSAQWDDLGQYYLDDCGTLYGDCLYLVKIIVKYCPINAIGEYDTGDSSNFKYFYRWMWTNTMFNKHYYHINDFDSIDLEIVLDVKATYSVSDEYYYKILGYNSPNIEVLKLTPDAYQYLSSKVQIITNSSLVTPEDDEENPGGGGDSGGGGSTEPETEEELTPAEVNVYVKINNGELQQVQISINRTLRLCYENKILLLVSENGTFEVLDPSNYNVIAIEGSSSIVLDLHPALDSTVGIKVIAEQGAFIYGKNLISPAFNTSPANQ